MSKLSWKEFFIELAKSIRLVDVHIQNKVGTITVGGRPVIINGNKGRVVGLGNFELVPDGKGGVHPKILDSEVEPISDKPENNVHSLDCDHKVFVLADIAENAIQISRPVDSSHECIINELKPILAVRQKDLGALLLSAQIMRIEDARDPHDLLITEDLRQQLSTCYLQRGNMIYNLYRSGILVKEILPHLTRQRELISASSEHFLSAFLAYWDGILSQGYPTAHFVGRGENYVEFEQELNARFLNSMVTKVRIFSRTDKRNRIVHNWCQRYVADKSGFQLSSGGTYRLGFGPAIIFTVSAARAPTPQKTNPSNKD